ncbi:MAG: cyclic nucleotide-binding domain-containing protein, partial [Deltaproteobacteria bacterium]|nr:cyclic nucleotide-binding domain-containing protein [Deltaproteobacteria bacterium]
QGDSGKGMYVILQGKVELSLGEASIDTEPVVIGHGEVFGKLGIGEPLTRTYTATAIDNSVLLNINERTLTYLENNSPKIAFTLYLNIVAIVDDRAEAMRGV